MTSNEALKRIAHEARLSADEYGCANCNAHAEIANAALTTDTPVCASTDPTPAMIKAGKLTMATLCLTDPALWDDALKRIWGSMTYAAASQAPETIERLRGALDEARFLCARLRELESDILDDEVGRQYYGHVSPSRVRLESALSSIPEPLIMPLEGPQ